MTQERIFIAGHKGMVGSALLRLISSSGEVLTRSRQELDLTDQLQVRQFFAQAKPTQVYLAAAKVGGIHANNSFPAEFLYQNLLIEANIIHSAFLSGTKKLLFLGSSCIYPKYAQQPIRESELLNGELEPTNEPYAIAKIAGIKLCESYNRQYGESHGIDFRSVMPTNLYGPGDNYHPEYSHVIPGLIRRFHEAKVQQRDEVVIWGTGTPKREFLHVDDLAAACVHVMNLPLPKYAQVTQPTLSHVNVGYGDDIAILDLAHLIAETVGFKGRIVCDITKPDGTPRKLMDSQKMRELGWAPKISLAHGLKSTYQDFVSHHV